MVNLFKSHKLYYLSFTALMLLCLALIFKTVDTPDVRFIVLLLTVFLYIFWGIAHHILHHDVSLRIVLEYLLVGGLGISLVLFLGS